MFTREQELAWERREEARMEAQEAAHEKRLSARIDALTGEIVHEPNEDVWIRFFEDVDYVAMAKVMAKIRLGDHCDRGLALEAMLANRLDEYAKASAEAELLGAK